MIVSGFYGFCRGAPILDVVLHVYPDLSDYAAAGGKLA